MFKFINERPYLIAIAIVAGCSAWFFSAPADDDSPRNDSADTVKTSLQRVLVQRFEPKPLVQTLRFNGQTQANKHIQLAAELSGRLLKVQVDVGDQVKAGDVVAEIDAGTLQSALDSATAERRSAELEYEAQRNLAKRGMNSRNAQSQAKAQLEAAQARQNEARRALRNRFVRAPFDALVSERFLDEGSFVNTGDAVVRLIVTNPLLVLGHVPEVEIAKVRAGQRANIELLDGQKAQGTVRFVSPQADPNTRSFSVEVAIDNPRGQLRAGVSASLSIEYDTIKAIKMPPSTLVLASDGQLGLRVVNEMDLVQFRPVSIVQSEADGVWLTGIAPQEQVITSGQGFVREAQKVVITTQPELDQALSQAQAEPRG